MIQAPMKTVITWWIAKSDSHMVHGRIQIYAGDTLVQTREIESTQTPEEGETPLGPIDVNYVVGYETVTVEAGTFTNCVKVEVTEEEQLIRTWAHESVPIYGMAKSEFYSENELAMVMELVAYGG